jgi:hypothetical protein
VLDYFAIFAMQSMQSAQALSAVHFGHLAHSRQVAQGSPGLQVLHVMPVFLQNAHSAVWESQDEHLQPARTTPPSSIEAIAARTNAFFMTAPPPDLAGT